MIYGTDIWELGKQGLGIIDFAVFGDQSLKKWNVRESMREMYGKRYGKTSGRHLLGEKYGNMMRTYGQFQHVYSWERWEPSTF